MKKYTINTITNIILTLLTGVLIMLVVFLSIHFYNFDKRQSKEQLLQYFCYTESTYEVKGTLTQQFIVETIQAIQLIPGYLLQDFYSNGWSICISSTNNNYLGLTSVKDKTIYIFYKECFISLVQDTVAHEFGHYVDYSYNFISTTSKFTDLYNAHQYKDNIRNDEYCYTNNYELFATLYRDYLLHKDNLQHYSNSYDFMNELLNQ